MSFFGKLFGNKQPPARPQAPPLPEPPPPRSEPEDAPQLIRAFDAYGREIFIPRDEWRSSVLPANLRAQWSNPAELYSLIVEALQDGFALDVVDAAEQLHRIDPIPTRGACAYAIALMKTGRLDDAERVLLAHTRRHGEEGVVLTNLAKVYADRNEERRAEETLWHALELDPNLDNAVSWYEVWQRERGGGEAGLEALRRIAALPGSWRAQLWLARAALESGERERALAYYRESLSRVGGEVPAFALMQVSGDLGMHGMLAELLQIAEPLFVPEQHGLDVGNNLIKAHLDLGQVQAARQIVDRLHALQRPDWREALGYWEEQIGRAGLAPPVDDPGAQYAITMLSVPAPIWAPPPADGERAGDDPARQPAVCFLGSSAEKPGPTDAVQHQLTDPAGRMSRALPLFLAEQVQLTCAARARTLVPWLAGDHGAFVLTGWPWSDEDAVRDARAGQPPAGHVVITHLDARSEPWSVQLRLVRTSDAALLGTLDASFASADPGDAIRTLARRLAALLGEQAGVPAAGNPSYELPSPATFPSYLVRLEQLLAVRAQGLDNASGGLTNPREIIDGNIQLCLDNPLNLTTRLLLVATLRAMHAALPEVVRESFDRVARLQREHPLSGEPDAVRAALREIYPPWGAPAASPGDT